MKKVLIIALAISLAMLGVAFASGVVGSDHDLRSVSTNLLGTGSGQVCVMCHHPHRGTGEGALTGNELLWNISSAAYGSSFAIYTSATINGSATALSSAGSGNAFYSLLCMGCHDGELAADALVRAPGDGSTNTIQLDITGAANLGSTLIDDHPVNFTYDTTLATNDGELQTPATHEVDGIGGTYDYPLFGQTMQCATCHDVHAGDLNSTAGHCSTNAGFSCDPKIEFMLGNTAASEICTDCHVK